jgi:LysM repeat protein
MRKGTPFLLTATVLLILPLGSMAAGTSTSGDLEQEYAQVRKIALKDPKVQEAFRKADERLDEKIIQIDPGLKPIVDRHSAASATVQTERPASEVHPASLPAAEGRHHIVVKGETLSSIAAHYNVRVATLEKVNHITDATKLRVGQRLLIPGAEVSETEPARESPTPEPKENDGLWDKLKSNL